MVYVRLNLSSKPSQHFPERCPYAPENGLWGNEVLRQLLFHGYSSKN